MIIIVKIVNKKQSNIYYSDNVIRVIIVNKKWIKPEWTSKNVVCDLSLIFIYYATLTVELYIGADTL